MNRTQFFTDSMALALRRELERRGIDVPVVGQINEPEPEGVRLEVRCEGSEEIIPGNQTYRLDCQVVLNLSASSMTAAEIERMMEDVSMACGETLGADWRHVPVEDPRGGEDAEYNASPFIVLDLITELQAPETNGTQYLGMLAFRAYVQF